MFIASAVLLTGVLSAETASADPYKRHARMNQQVPASQTYVPRYRAQNQQWAQRRISAAQAKSIALRRYPGATYVDMIPKGNVYRVVLLLRNGKRKVVIVNAITGFVE
jgi:uncharacterized membrane protein YkoI